MDSCTCVPAQEVVLEQLCILPKCVHIACSTVGSTLRDTTGCSQGRAAGRCSQSAAWSLKHLGQLQGPGLCKHVEGTAQDTAKGNAEAQQHWAPPGESSSEKSCLGRSSLSRKLSGTFTSTQGLASASPCLFDISCSRCLL